VTGAAARRSDVRGESSENKVAPRHFLDLRDFDSATLRQMLDVASGFKRAGGVSSRPLAGKTLVRLSLNGNTVASEERLLQNLNERIRDVRQGPDGALWLLTDNAAGRILRVSPAPK